MRYFKSNLKNFLLRIELTFIYSSSFYYFQKVKRQRYNDTSEKMKFLKGINYLK